MNLDCSTVGVFVPLIIWPLHLTLALFLYGFHPGLHSQLILMTYLRSTAWRTLLPTPPEPGAPKMVDLSKILRPGNLANPTRVVPLR